jgi:predicted nucleotide-binding protein
MALNPTLIQFFVDRIQGSSINTFAGTVNQLFEHLRTEVKDNPVFDKYEAEEAKWESWPEDNAEVSFRGNDWEMPSNFWDAKSLAYNIYKKVGKIGDIFGLLIEITGERKFDDSIYKFNQFFIGHLAKALEDIMNANPELEKGMADKVKGNKLFIIHGHDELLKKDIQLLLLRAGVNNIVLHEQPDKGRTIIDKLIEEGNHSNYAIALLSPDDLLMDGKGRARQNVILEIGYFIGQLGKERVRMLVKGDLDIPSDLQGILYEKVDESGNWRMKILKELMAVGIYVDLDKVVGTL